MIGPLGLAVVLLVALWLLGAPPGGLAGLLGLLVVVVVIVAVLGLIDPAGRSWWRRWWWW